MLHENLNDSLENKTCSQTTDDSIKEISQNELLTDSIVQISAQLTKIQVIDPIDESNLRSKMDMLTKLYISLVNILRENPEIIQWNKIAENEVDLIGPILKLISFALLQNDDENLKILVGLFSSLIWFFLSNDKFHSTFKKSLLEYCVNNNDELSQTFISIKNETPLAGIISNWNIQMLLGKLPDISRISSILSLSNAYNSNFLEFFWANIFAFSNLVEDLSNCLNIKKNQFTKSQNNNLFIVLEQIFMFFESDNDLELICLLIIRDKSLLTKLEILSTNKSLTTTNRNCIAKLLEHISNTALLNPYLLGSNKNLLKKIDSDYLLLSSNIDGNKKENATNSFKFILEALDQNVKINYLTSNNLASYLLLSLNQIGNCMPNKLEFYSTFNELKSKISILSMSLNLNFVLSLNLLNLFDDCDVPNLVFANFSHLNLPPLPKSNTFFRNNKKKDVFNNDCTSAHNKDNFNKVIESLLRNLMIINYCFKYEITSLASVDTDYPKSISQKIISKLVDSVFSSLFTTLMFIDRYNNQTLATEFAANIIYKIIMELVDLDLPLFGNYMMWISLINFSNDICFYSVSNVSIFSRLFKYLIQNDTNALQDPLVKSGLEYFITTFIKSDTNLDVSISSLNSLSSLSNSFAEISLDEYNFLYSELENANNIIGNQSVTETERSSNCSFTKNQNSTNSSTPLRLTNNQYSTRQQSTHIDSYKG